MIFNSGRYLLLTTDPEPFVFAFDRAQRADRRRAADLPAMVYAPRSQYDAPMRYERNPVLAAARRYSRYSRVPLAEARVVLSELRRPEGMRWGASEEQREHAIRVLTRYLAVFG